MHVEAIITRTSALLFHVDLQCGRTASHSPVRCTEMRAVGCDVRDGHTLRLMYCFIYTRGQTGISCKGCVIGTAWFTSSQAHSPDIVEEAENNNKIS